MKFYVLKNPAAGSLCETDFDEADFKTGDAPSCPVCGRVTGMLEWLPPRKITLVRYGKFFGDILKNINVLVSDRFRIAWIAEGLVGIDEFCKVDIVDVRPKKAMQSTPFYYYIAPKTTTTAGDYSKSLYVDFRPPHCDYCGGGGVYTAAGFCIVEATWSGEDIFCTRNISGTIIVTQRFVDMVHKHNLTNALMIPVEQYLWDPLHKIVPYSKDKN